MIRNAWHISGGEGWCQNTTCRRVLVTHTDGRQTVEEIKNDLGIAADDKAAMIARLVEQVLLECVYFFTSQQQSLFNCFRIHYVQGISDIQSIDLKGSTDNTTEPVCARPVTAPARTGRRAQGGAATIVLG